MLESERRGFSNFPSASGASVNLAEKLVMRQEGVIRTPLAELGLPHPAACQGGGGAGVGRGLVGGGGLNR